MERRGVVGVTYTDISVPVSAAAAAIGAGCIGERVRIKSAIIIKRGSPPGCAGQRDAQRERRRTAAGVTLD